MCIEDESNSEYFRIDCSYMDMYIATTTAASLTTDEGSLLESSRKVTGHAHQMLKVTGHAHQILKI